MRNRTFAAVVLFAVVLSPAFAQETVRVRCTEAYAVTLGGVQGVQKEAVPIFFTTGDAVPDSRGLFVVDGYEVYSMAIAFGGYHDDGVSRGAYVETFRPAATGTFRPAATTGPIMMVEHPLSPNGAFAVWVSCDGTSQGYVLVDPPDFVDVVDVGEPLPLGESTGGRP